MRLLTVTPTLGVIRLEWAMGKFGQAVPCNWSQANVTLGPGYFIPMHYLVDDAQNLGVKTCVEQNYDWMLLWEDDVIPPIDALLQLNDYMKKGDIPVVSGLYFTKGTFSEPILYRGIGTSSFTDFKIGDKVWASAVPTGFLLINRKVLEVMYKESSYTKMIDGKNIKKVFETVSKVFYDTKTQSYSAGRGTSDLIWCKRVVEEKVLQRAGFPKIGRKKYPFLCDTNIFCKHIDLTSGRQFPEEIR